MADISFLFYRIALKIYFSSLTNYRKSYITRVTYVTVISDIYSDLTLSNICIHGPSQANLVLIAYANSEGSGEPAHPRSLVRTSAARSYKQ